MVKAGLLMLTKPQAVEWAPYGIRANAITPGYIRTPGTEAMYVDPEIYEGRRKGVPMGRVGAGARHRRRGGLPCIGTTLDTRLEVSSGRMAGKQ